MSKKVIVDFSLDAWLNGLEVEVEDWESVIEALSKMDIMDIVKNANVKDYDIKDLDYEVVERTYVIEVKNITYEIDEFDLEQKQMTFEEIEKTLPKQLTIEIEWNKERDKKFDFDREIEAEIFYQTDFYPLNFDWKILKD